MSETGASTLKAESIREKTAVKNTDNDCFVSTQPSVLESDVEQAAPAAAPLSHAKSAPDGGLEAWMVVLGAWAASFCSFGWLSSAGVFQEYYQNVLLDQYSPSTISWIPSLQIFFMLGTGPFAGIIYDKYGPRYLLLGGSFLHVFGVMMASLGTEYWHIILAQGLVSGIGTSAIFQASLSSIHGWFDKNRAAAFGVLSTGSSTGGIIFPVLLTRLIDEVGFPWAMRTAAFILLALLILSNFTIKSRNPPIPQHITGRQLIKPLTELDFSLVNFGFFIFSFGFYATLTYLPAQVIAAGMDRTLASYILSILNAGSMFGRLAAGVLGDKVGRYNIFVIVCYMSGILILALWLPAANDATLVAFAVLFGFFSGAYVTLIAPLVMQISPMAEIGFRTGVILLTSSFAGLTTGPINGSLLDRPGNWDNIKIFSGVFCLVGTTLIFVARIRRTGLKLLVVF
ncbi:hypothetical protein S40288_01002 [Stachybotrys chartarum IBT 40288]|nr:hypothetical protein S40288_01002 [Stachybotrys chartarum IBT 40288]